MSALGQKQTFGRALEQTFGRALDMSALPPKADIFSRGGIDVR